MKLSHLFVPLIFLQFVFGLQLSSAATKTFNYVSDFDGNGVIHYLATANQQTPYENPHLKGLVTASASSLSASSTDAYAILGDEVVRCATDSVADSWMQVDFKNRKVIPTHYTLRHYATWDTEALRNWVLEASNDASSWTTLNTHTNDTSLDSIGDTQTWLIPSTSQDYRYFRIRQTGLNSNNHNYLALSGFEIYGDLISDGDYDSVEEYTFTNSFAYVSDFDTNGLIYYIASRGGFGDYENPALNGFIDVNSSELADDSEPLFSIVGDETVRCVTKSQVDAWMSIDLKERRINPTHYSLRHYATWDTEALRDWTLEGSNDGSEWFTLKSHTQDGALNSTGDTHTWIIDPSSDVIAYSKFRLQLTGTNSSNHYYLALSGFEVYGTLYTPSSAPSLSGNYDQRSSSYTTDFAGDGIIAHLATDDGQTEYVNPALKGYLTISASSIATDSDPKEAIVGNQTVRCVSNTEPDAWMAINFRNRRVKPAHYTLRHYSSWGTEALRNWVLEASVDGTSWIPISTHVEDTALLGQGDTQTWAIPQSSKVVPYQHFRIRQTGPNSNAHNYLALSGFEIYGTLYTPYEDSYFLGHDTTQLIHLSDFDGKGLVAFLATSGGLSDYKNPAETGYVDVRASSIETDSEPAASILGDSVVRCLTTSGGNAWFSVDFKDLRIKPTHYSLRHYLTWGTEALRNWVLEGSNDGGDSWIVISEHNADASLAGVGDTATWTIPGTNYVVAYRQFRIRQTGVNSNNHLFLALSGFEIYGELEYDFGVNVTGQYTQTGAHVHASDFDSNGIIYSLATSGGFAPYTNPESSGWVKTSASSLDATSEPTSAIVGNQVVRCVTQPLPDSWMAVEFLNQKVQPTHYTLRHYSSWNTEALRNWVLEASNNGINWVTLSEHTNDTSLNSIGATHTWAIPGADQLVPYSHFRIRQTGVNSNNHHYLALSGFEVYGTTHSAYLDRPADPVYNPQEVASASGDEGRDIVYYLGSAGRTKNFTNPAQDGLMGISASTVLNDSEAPEALLEDNLIRFSTASNPNSWVLLDFKGRKVVPRYYSLRHYSSWDAEALRNWSLEGSNDCMTWDVLREHINDTTLNSKGQKHTWQIGDGLGEQAYRWLRIRQAGLNSNNHHYLALSEIEVYGILQTPVSFPPLTRGNGPHAFSYVSDFDENGIVHYLATSAGNFDYTNPADANILAVTALSLAPDSEPASAIVGNEVVRCVTQDTPSSWMQIDFQAYEIQPTHYSLRHYSSWDTEALRNWVLEGSNDASQWEIISTHVNDTALNAKGATHTWPITGLPSNTWYRYFRIRQTGSNSNSHDYLALSGFEIYGELEVRQGTQYGGLQVLLEPAGAVTAGASWSLDTGATWHSSGETLSNLNIGLHTVTMQSTTGYLSPARRTFTIQLDQTQTSTETYLLDADGDKISDLWEIDHGLNPADPADALIDHDKDGQVTLVEYHAGTDMNDPNSRLRTWVEWHNGKAELHLVPVANSEMLILQSSPDVENWADFTPVIDDISGNERIVEEDPSAASGNRFYRIRIK